MTSLEVLTNDQCAQVRKRSLQSPATAGLRVDAYEGQGESLMPRASGLV